MNNKMLPIEAYEALLSPLALKEFRTSAAERAELLQGHLLKIERDEKDIASVQLPTRRTSRKPGETFSASPLPTENSWRVLGNHGTLEAFRVSEIQAEDLAARLNALPVD